MFKIILFTLYMDMLHRSSCFYPKYPNYSKSKKKNYSKSHACFVEWISYNPLQGPSHVIHASL